MITKEKCAYRRFFFRHHHEDERAEWQLDGLVVKAFLVGREPLDVEYTPDGRYICTTNNEDNTVSVIDAATSKVIGTIKTGKQPTSIDFLPNGRQGYVTDEGGGTVEILNFPH